MMAVLALVAVWPLARTIWFGFTDASLTAPGDYGLVGFANYLEAYDGAWYGILADPTWWRALANTLIFAAASVTLETVLGIAMALVLNADFPGRGWVRAAVLVPWAIPTVVSAKLWGWMLHDQFGIINDMLMRLGLISAPVAWTATPDTAMAAVMMVDIWKTTPFMALLILAGLQMIPNDIYEAARLDGIGPVRVFRRVTLPLVLPALLVGVVFRALDALRVFDIVYVLTPNTDATRTMSLFARENLFDYDKFAYGSAASTLLFLIVAIITIGFIYATRMDLEGKEDR
ncbi:MAG TPA: ABC transporter permease [Tistrella mobilis]|uniref:ABC transporter permease n=1 Tax=Tistrella mobilis TaxID=171437 RepID=A0A3B9IHN8_9PROT|nr:ABC transporter permease [Tistrella mobilis]